MAGRRKGRRGSSRPASPSGQGGGSGRTSIILLAPPPAPAPSPRPASRVRTYAGRASNFIRRTAARITRRSAGGGTVTAPKANPGMKWDIASIFRETLLQGAGGVTSAALSQGAKLTENTYDDSPLLQTVVKGTLGLVLRWSFKDRPGVKQFVAGMNGHSIGSAVDQYVINKLAAAVTKGS